MMETYTDTQKIFLLSRANGADNAQDLLPVNGWEWPRNGFLTRRLRQLREEDRGPSSVDRRPSSSEEASHEN